MKISKEFKELMLIIFIILLVLGIAAQVDHVKCRQLANALDLEYSYRTIRLYSCKVLVNNNWIPVDLLRIHP